ncbi:hypothetical protein Tco_0564494 [Tanacetum coccineum]
MFHNLDQLRLQLERENLHGVNAKTCLQALRTQFKEFLASKGVNATDLLNQGWQQDFEDFTRCEPSAYRRDLLENLDTLEAVIHRAVITYGRLQLQSQDVQINPVQAVDDSLNVSKSSWIELENHNALSKSVNETQLQQHESLVTESTTLEANLNSDVKALDAGSVITESSETKSDMHDTSNSSRTYITHVVDANIRPVNDQVPSAEVHLTVPHNVLATEQYQAKSPLLKAELVKSKEMIEKETYNELSRSFSKKESVRFSALYLQKKRNLLVFLTKLITKLSYFPMLVLLVKVDQQTLLIRWQREILHLNLQDDNRFHHCSEHYRWKGKPSQRVTKVQKIHLPHSIDIQEHKLHPEPVQEDQTGSNSRKLHVSLAGPNPEHMDDELTEAEEEAVAREVHATHARIVSGPDLEPMQEDQTGSNSGKLHVSSCRTNPDTWMMNTSRQPTKSYRGSDSTIPDTFIRTNKLDDASPKFLERHTADLIEKYSALPGPESIKNQESEKSPKEIIRIKREQGEEKQDSTYSIRNPANYHLYHALMEALIADEDAMDKEVAVKVKDHKRKHDSDDEEDDDDDEGPSAGSNQGRSAKRRRPESAASVSSASFENGSTKENSKRQPRTGGSNEGTGNILGVPDESTVISRASSEGTGSKPGVPDEEKLIL